MAFTIQWQYQSYIVFFFILLLSFIIKYFVRPKIAFFDFGFFKFFSKLYRYIFFLPTIAWCRKGLMLTKQYYHYMTHLAYINTNGSVHYNQLPPPPFPIETNSNCLTSAAKGPSDP